VSRRATLARRLGSVHPFEWAAVAGTVLGVGFLRWRGLSIDRVAVAYTVPPLIVPVAKALALGVGLQALYLAATSQSLPIGYLRRVGTWPWLLLTLRIGTVCLLFTFTYFWMKVSVPLVNWTLWDPELWRLDRILHLGLSPSIFLTALVDGTVLAPILERWYGWWIVSMMLGLGFFCALPDALERRRFMLATVLLWIVGAWLYTALPAVGPAYTHPEVWHELQSAMPSARDAQATLWENYQRVLKGRTEPLRQFNPTRGVAAFPSLHVAGHWLLMLWAWRAARPLFVPFAIGTLLTFLGSIVTGWHYAVDGYAGILLAQGVWWVGLKLEAGERPLSPRGGGPAPESPGPAPP
jgi:hypothetical protein